MMPTLLSRQALWDYELGQCLLESGAPDRAADYFTRALKLVPEIAIRPIAAYYLERMGQPVPPLPKGGTATVGTEAKPSTPLPVPGSSTPAAPKEPAKPAPAAKGEEAKK
jgi:hypothetical protein